MSKSQPKTTLRHRQISKDVDGDFFEFQLAKLPDKRTDPDVSSSSDEEEMTTGDSGADDDDPDQLSGDLFSKLQSQFSTLSVQTNFKDDRFRPSRSVPGKYLLDETARRWSTKTTGVKENIFPSPKHQDGRSKILQKSATVRQTSLSLWQYFMTDRFLEIHVSHWFNKKDAHVSNVDGKSGDKGKQVNKEKSAIGQGQKIDLVDSDELKAFFAVLYARAASSGEKTDFDKAWDGDAFSPPFFDGAMKKERFFGLLKEFVANQNEPLPTPRESTAAPSFLNEFNYRLIQSFDPGDTLAISDRTVKLKRRICQSPFLSPGGEREIEGKAVISWLRDARCGYFLKMAPPVCKNLSGDNMIIDMIRMPDTTDSIKHVRMDETVRFLVGQPPTSGSGRTVYVGSMHAGVDCASELYERHKLRLVGLLPSSGFYDCRVPIIAKSRSVLKRPIGSSLFLFDHPLMLISYQRRSSVQMPDVLVSTAHCSKEKADSSDNDCPKAGEQSRHSPPCAWTDYRQFLLDVIEPTYGFCSHFVNDADMSNMSLERILFFDCLYAAAYNAFVLWKPQQPRDRSPDFKTFLKLLSCQLAKPYITKRLSASVDTDGGNSAWRSAAKQILRDLEQSEEVVDESGVSKSNPSTKNDAGPSSGQVPDGENAAVASTKKQERKQHKKSGKRRK